MRIGLLIPSANTVTEHDFQRAFRGDPPVHTARMFLRSGTRAAEEDMLRTHLPVAVRDLADIECSVVVFACTSGAAGAGTAGEQALMAMIAEHTGATKVVNAYRQTVTALRQRGWHRIGLITPYIADVADAVANGLAAAGFEVTGRADMGIKSAADIGAVAPGEVGEFVLSTVNGWDGESVDGVFVSCNNLPASHLTASPLPSGHRVITSNSVLVEEVRSLIDIGR